MTSPLPGPGNILAWATPHAHHEILGAVCGLLVGVAGIIAAVWFKMRLLEREGALPQDTTQRKDGDKLSW